MMAASSSSSNLSDHLVQDDHLPWPASSSSSLLPFAPAPHHSAIIGGNQLWCQQPLTLNCADRHHSDELEVLLSAQGGGGGHHQSHSHSSSHPSAVIPHLPPQLSSLLMMQDLGFQWSNCGGSFLDTSSPSMAPMNNGHHQHDNGHDDNVKEEDPLIVNSSGSSCASTAIACHDDIVLDGGGGGGGRLPTMAAVAVATDLDGGATTVLPSVNISRPATMTTTTHQRPSLFPAAPPPLPCDAFEILASSRLCKTLLLSQASSVLLHNGAMPLLRSEHVAYGPPPPAAYPQGPSIDNNYKQMGTSCLDAAGGGRHWSAEHDAACQSSAAAAAARPVPSSKKPRIEQRSSSSVVPSFKVRKEKLGDRIAALQQLVSPFGKTDTASVLMEAIGYIKFLQDQVETLSRPYLKSSRSMKPKPTQRGSSNANAGEQQEETRLDLRSRGLCLVPLSCTSYVTNENGVWVPPNFRGN